MLLRVVCDGILLSFTIPCLIPISLLVERRKISRMLVITYVYVSPKSRGYSLRLMGLLALLSSIKSRVIRASRPNSCVSVYTY